MVAPDGAQLWLVRHGETEWSRDGRHTGRTDVPLTAHGEAQARAVGRLLAAQLGERQPYTLCSPLGRAQRTAELAGLAVADYDDDLREWDYGAYEGRTTAEIRAERPGWTLFRDGVPDGETIEDVAERADRVIARAMNHLDGRPVALVAHGHISRVIGARWIDAAPQLAGNMLLSTAAPSLLSAQYGEPVIDRWNIPNPLVQNGGAR